MTLGFANAPVSLLFVSAVLSNGLPAALLAQGTESDLALHQSRAQQAEARQDFAAAVREYTLLVQQVPGSAELKSNLGVALYFHHDLKKAAEVFRQAIALNPSLYAPHLFLGLTMAQLAQPDAAVTELERAAVLNDSDPLVHTWLGYEYTAQSRFEKAAQQLETAAQLKPDDQDVWFALGRCYLELGKAETMRLIRLNPDGGRVFQLAAEQYETQGNSGKALKFYSTALQRRPDIEELRAKIVALGGTIQGVPVAQTAHGVREDQIYDVVHKYEKKAQDSFARIGRIDPDSYRAHQVLADSDAAADHYDEATKEYRIVLDRKPDLPGIHGDMCNALSRTGRLDEAAKECEAEIARSPFSAEAYVQAARVYQLTDNNERAAVLLQKALTLDRPPIFTYKLLGKVYLAQSKYGAAIDALTKYLATETQDASAYYLLARAYKATGETGKMNRAISEYRRTSDLAKIAGEALGSESSEDASPIDDTGKESKPL